MNRKELKDAYKQQKFKMGVFQIRNAVNQKILVESSINLDAIWNRYRFALNMGGHPNILVSGSVPGHIGSIVLIQK